jgi:hypothetical protein
MLANCAKAHLMSSCQFLKLRSGPLRRAVIINFFRWFKHLRSAPNPIVTAAGADAARAEAFLSGRRCLPQACRPISPDARYG